MAPILRYFVVRPAVEVTLPSGEVERRPDTIVPLIPMDMIPEGVEIKGIPRQMSPTETMGMTHVGTTSLESDNGGKALALHQQQTGSSTSTAPTGLCYTPASFEQPMGHEPKTQASQFLRNVPRPLALPLTPDGTPTSQRSMPLKPSEHVETPVRQARPLKTSNRSQTPSDKSEEPSHCQQWCHHGRCDRGGSCRSKHDMPKSQDGLRAVGLERLPEWWFHRKNHRQQPFRGAKDRWGSRHSAGRGSNESSPTASPWTPKRYEGRFDGHAEKVRAEKERMVAHMNRDNPAVQKETEMDERERNPTAAELRSSRESHDLLSLDILEPLSRSGADRSDY